jgi:hypothetical protein
MFGGPPQSFQQHNKDHQSFQAAAYSVTQDQSVFSNIGVSFKIPPQPHPEFTVLSFQNKNDLTRFCSQVLKAKSQGEQNYIAAKFHDKTWKQTEQEFSSLLKTHKH